MTRILVVDDDPALVRALRINLSARGYEVDAAGTGADALRLAASHHPDLVVLDLGLPDLDGVEVIAGLRGWSAVPIVVLSGRAGSDDKVHALDAGADDYVTKPFGVDELLARIRAVSRRAVPGEEEPAVRIGDFEVDLAAKEVRRIEGDPAGEQVRLTPIEWKLLEVLVRNPGKLVSGRQLLAEVWGPGYETESHYLRQHLARLRHKLEKDPSRPRHLVTEPGMGYRFAP